MTSSRSNIKRETDLQLISEWIEPGARVLDLGCGRGVLLEHLQQTKQIYGVGVDNAIDKIQSCVKRRVNAYQGDAESFLAEFEPGAFDWIILSRTIQELERPADTLRAALRVGKRLAIGFVNQAFWLNRWSILRTGERIRNDVYPHTWRDGPPAHPLTIANFEAFCRDEGYPIERRVYLRGDWKTPCHRAPNLLAGYAVYAIRPAE